MKRGEGNKKMVKAFLLYSLLKYKIIITIIIIIASKILLHTSKISTICSNIYIYIYIYIYNLV